MFSQSQEGGQDANLDFHALRLSSAVRRGHQAKPGKRKLQRQWIQASEHAHRVGKKDVEVMLCPVLSDPHQGFDGARPWEKLPHAGLGLHPS